MPDSYPRCGWAAHPAHGDCPGLTLSQSWAAIAASMGGGSRLADSSIDPGLFDTESAEIFDEALARWHERHEPPRTPNHRLPPTPEEVAERKANRATIISGWERRHGPGSSAEIEAIFARTDVPALVAEVRQLREENAALRLDLDIERRTRQEHIERLGLTSMAATLNALSDAEDKILRLEAELSIAAAPGAARPEEVSGDG